MDGHYKPIISQDDFEEMLGWLVEHGLKHNQVRVLGRISRRFPDFMSTAPYPAKHLSLARSFLDNLFKDGPLPEITNPQFCFTLMDVVTGVLANQDRIYGVLERSKVALMISGLRFLLVLSLLSSDKYDICDVRNCLNIYFPECLYSVNSSQWIKLKKLLRAEDEQESLRKMIAASCTSARNFVAEKLKTGSKKVDSASSLKIWEGIRPCLGTLLTYLNTTLKSRQSTVECLSLSTVEECGVLQGYVLDGVGKAEEEDVLAFMDDLDNLRKESAFWLWNSAERIS